MKTEIDSGSGFCFGVVYAIRMAEEYLDKHGKLYCLGDIVHNNVEVARLAKKGLITIDHEMYKTLTNCNVLIRAHGEPPDTYRIALENNIRLIDASCPVVLKLQNKIKIGFDEIKKLDGQVVIYGKEGHAEVNGLVGQTGGEAIVVNSIADLDRVDFTKPINLFAQTTQSKNGFAIIIKEIKKRMLQQQGDPYTLITNDSICHQVSSREPQLRLFVKRHDVVVFVSGKKSSNGKILYEVCTEENPATHFVSDCDDLQKSWFTAARSVGICGATSSPRWLMEKIDNCIRQMLAKNEK